MRQESTIRDGGPWPLRDQGQGSPLRGPLHLRCRAFALCLVGVPPRASRYPNRETLIVLRS